jgi:hypothetical protein
VAALFALAGSLVGFATIRKQQHPAPEAAGSDAVPAELVEY